jgi:hypothetical protein
MTNRKRVSRRYTEPLRAGDGLKRKYVHHCQTCGKLFFSSRALARYDTNACRQKAYRKRKAHERWHAELTERLQCLIEMGKEYAK